VRPGLPPPGSAASGAAVELDSPERGELLLLPPQVYPARARVTTCPEADRGVLEYRFTEDEQQLGGEMASRGIVIPLPAGDIIVHTGQLSSWTLWSGQEQVHASRRE